MSAKLRGPGPQARQAAFTLLEMLFVMLMISILALIVLPVVSKAKARARSVSCSSQLRQVGIALHEFSHDHLDQFPFLVPTNQGGTLEFARAGFAMSGEFFFAYRHFQILSNTLVTPRMLLCSTDTRLPASDFSTLQNPNLSYFISTSAEFSKPESILCGDRNISGEALASGSIVRTGTNAPMIWTAELHHFRGNLLFSDSHVAQVNNSGLGAAIYAAGPSPGYLLPPIAPPPFTEPDNTSIFLAAKETIGSWSQSSSSTPGVPQDSTKIQGAPPSGVRFPAGERPSRVDSSGVSESPAPPFEPSRKLEGRGKADSAPPEIEQPLARTNLAAKGEMNTLKRITSQTPTATPAKVADAEFNSILRFAQHPEQHTRSWLLLLLFVTFAAFMIGRQLHRRRQRRLGPA